MFSDAAGAKVIISKRPARARTRQRLLQDAHSTADGERLRSYALSSCLSRCRKVRSTTRTLTGTLTVCAWTNRVKLETSGSRRAYLKRKYGLRISHGMSPEAHQMMAEGVFDPGTSNVPGTKRQSRLRRLARVFLEPKTGFAEIGRPTLGRVNLGGLIEVPARAIPTTWSML